MLSANQLTRRSRRHRYYSSDDDDDNDDNNHYGKVISYKKDPNEDEIVTAFIDADDSITMPKSSSATKPIDLTKECVTVLDNDDDNISNNVIIEVNDDDDDEVVVVDCMKTTDKASRVVESSRRVKRTMDEYLTRKNCKRRRRNHNDDVVIESTESTAARLPEYNDVEVLLATQQRLPEYEILDVFPDADIEYVRTTLHDCNNDVSTALTYIADKENSYPKSNNHAMLSSPSFLIRSNEKTTFSNIKQTEHDQDARNNNQASYDYMSSESFIPSGTYIQEAYKQLCYDFLFLSMQGARKVMEMNHSHYAICHHKILEACKEAGRVNSSSSSSSNVNDIGDYDFVANALDGILSSDITDRIETILFYRDRAVATMGKKMSPSKKLPKKLRHKSCPRASYVLKKPRKRLSSSMTAAGGRPSGSGIHDVFVPAISDPILMIEVPYVKQKFEEWRLQIKKKLGRKDRQTLAQQRKIAIECACCYDTYHYDDIISCQKNDTNHHHQQQQHFFCGDCIQTMLENLIFGQGNLGYVGDKKQKELALELKCFHGDGCSYGFHHNDLKKVILSSTLFTKYEEMQFQLSINKAGLSTTIRSCPKCHYQCDVPSMQNIFCCPVDICQYESCILCGDKAHIPLRCEEVIKDKVETDGRTKVEEAISAAKIRTCPKCDKSFIKSDGCNKITCSCGTLICYECRQVVTNGYQHFCQVPHCDHTTCRRCRLYTNAEEDDKKAMREAGLKAAATAAEIAAATVAASTKASSLLATLAPIDIEKYIS